MIDQVVLRQIVEAIEKLPEDQVAEVLDFARFLKTRSVYNLPKRSARRIFDETIAAKLYAEATGDDRQMAESGIADYASALKTEDADAKG